MFEGTPSYPENDRWWDIIERHKVTILYTAPDRHPGVHEGRHGGRSRSTTFVACACSGASGEPINPRAWVWYYDNVGGGRCPRSWTRGGRRRRAAS
jgi:acetyl-CoA synthetase